MSITKAELEEQCQGLNELIIDLREELLEKEEIITNFNAESDFGNERIIYIQEVGCLVGKTFIPGVKVKDGKLVKATK